LKFFRSAELRLVEELYWGVPMSQLVPPCQDCGTTTMPLDTVLTGKQWGLICPEGGTLCANCIVARAARLKDVINVCLRITFSDDYEGPEAGGRVFQMLKALDG
jgi:hypothetical protein